MAFTKVKLKYSDDLLQLDGEKVWLICSDYLLLLDGERVKLKYLDCLFLLQYWKLTFLPPFLQKNGQFF